MDQKIAFYEQDERVKHKSESQIHLEIRFELKRAEKVFTKDIKPEAFFV